MSISTDNMDSGRRQQIGKIVNETDTYTYLILYILYKTVVVINTTAICSLLVWNCLQQIMLRRGLNGKDLYIRMLLFVLMFLCVSESGVNTTITHSTKVQS